MAKVYITRDLKTYTNGRFEIALQGESIKDYNTPRKLNNFL